jgi:hypothetical protein
MKARTDGAVAVIDIGHERTDVVVVYQNKAVFSRSIPRAGKQVTEAIARNWKLPFDRAEQAKHADGFVASNQEPPQSDAWAKISNVLIQELAPFSRDLRQTIAACRAATGFSPLAAVLVGGGSRLRGIGSYMSEQLGLPAWRLTRDDVVALAGPRMDPNAAVNLPIDTAAMTVGMAYDAAGGRPQFDLQSGALAAKMDLSCSSASPRSRWPRLPRSARTRISIGCANRRRRSRRGSRTNRPRCSVRRAPPMKCSAPRAPAEARKRRRCRRCRRGT